MLDRQFDLAFHNISQLLSQKTASECQLKKYFNNGPLKYPVNYLSISINQSNKCTAEALRIYNQIEPTELGTGDPTTDI